MLYTTNQVAEILGITGSGVAYLAKHGRLKIADRTENKEKGHLRFDPLVVQEFSKIYKKNHRDPATLKPKKVRIKKELPTPEVVKMIPNSNLMNRLDRIEAKIDAILNIWK